MELLSLYTASGLLMTGSTNEARSICFAGQNNYGESSLTALEHDWSEVVQDLVSSWRISNSGYLPK
jgi:hypothetical protein